MEQHRKSLFFAFGQIGHLGMIQAKKILEAYHLKPGQADILFALNREGELSQKELASQLKLTPPSITTALKKMEQQEYILRKTDKKDQRITRIYLADKGREYLEHIRDAEMQMEMILRTGLDEKEVETLKMLLEKVRYNLIKKMDFQEQEDFLRCETENRKREDS